MTTRQTALALLAFFAGFGMLFLLDGTVATVVGAVLLTLGACGALAAGALGIRVADQRRADAAEAERDAGTAAAMKRGMETGRWPRVIGGG